VSSAPKVPNTPPDERPVITVPRIGDMKASGEPIVMVTAYDYPSALAVEEAGVDVVLVGDTAAMVVLGHDSTTPVGMDEMITMAAAVRRGLKTPLLIGDMPFGSYEASNEQAISNAQLFIKEAGCAAVKLERGGPSVDRARAIVRSGIPVMGHVGLTPQTASALGGFKAQGRTAEKARRLVEDAIALEAAGCFALVLEAVPSPVAAKITEALSIPTIGIGAGASCDGQVLVYHDLLGLYEARAPRFVKRYAGLADEIRSALEKYAEDVRTGRFPEEQHGYAMPDEELEAFHGQVETVEPDRQRR
jgi:3-methyl-2-oxobutanoate hydroxymethyltransferase